MAIPLECENIRRFIQVHNRALVNIEHNAEGVSKEYLWGARFVIKLLARTWAEEVMARRRQGK